MGVRTWGAGLVAAAIISAMTASGAPVIAADTAQVERKASAQLSELPASLADAKVANTPHADHPDATTFNWPCKQPMRIYYTGSIDIDNQRILRELEYPVRYLRDLGYDVKIVREVAYRYDYLVPSTPGDLLLIVATGDVQKTELAGPTPAWGVTEYSLSGKAVHAAKITINGNRGLPSDVILHELGHALGLDHKDGTAMTERGLSTGAFDAGETAAVDCR